MIEYIGGGKWVSAVSARFDVDVVRKATLSVDDAYCFVVKEISNCVLYQEEAYLRKYVHVESELAEIRLDDWKLPKCVFDSFLYVEH